MFAEYLEVPKQEHRDRNIGTRERQGHHGRRQCKRHHHNRPQRIWVEKRCVILGEGCTVLERTQDNPPCTQEHDPREPERKGAAPRPACHPIPPNGERTGVPHKIHRKDHNPRGKNAICSQHDSLNFPTQTGAQFPPRACNHLCPD